MNKSITLPSPCKLNLFLYITGRRPDGYHNLQTLFTILDFGDEMTFVPREDGQIVIHGPFDFPTEKNTIYKALMLLKDKAAADGRLPEGNADKAQRLGMEITVAKRIPEGGGLGGGSSNAATAMLAANKLWGLDYSVEELLPLGVKIGADVPVFVGGQAAFASGVGEKLTPVTLPERWYVVAAPEGCQVNTAKAFADPELTRDSPVRDFAQLMELGYHNDFTFSVVKNHPEIGQLLSLLVKYAPAHLSGSGASCSIEFESSKEALNALQSLKQIHRGPLFMARSVVSSPVHDALLQL